VGADFFLGFSDAGLDASFVWVQFVQISRQGLANDPGCLAVTGSAFELPVQFWWQMDRVWD
jgi:hypothetical protein